MFYSKCDSILLADYKALNMCYHISLDYYDYHALIKAIKSFFYQ